jgi:hypothetical protein
MHELIDRIAHEIGLTKSVATVGGFDVPHYLVSDFKMITLVQRIAEECAQACERVAYTHPSTAMLGPEQNALKCAAAVRAKFKEPTNDR